MIPIRNIEWQGRNLTKLGTNTFAYDEFGNRRRKNSIYFTYDSQDNLIEQSNGLHFMYDHTGVMGFTYQGQTYFYQKDLQGNIVTIVNAAGAPVAQYYYDAWGNHKVYDGDYITEMTSPTFIGNLNPFRYRGYYYDVETKLYYLQSRYYDPEVGRFISADTIDYAEPSQFNGLNIYAYCNNNPVMFVDPSGHSWKKFWQNVGAWIKENKDIVILGVVAAASVALTIVSFGAAATLSAVVVGALVGAAFGTVNAYVNGDTLLYGALSGAALGALGAIGLEACFAVCVSSMTLSLIGDVVNNREKNYGSAIIHGITALAFSAGNSFVSKIFDNLPARFIGDYVLGTCFTGLNMGIDNIIK